MILLLDTSTPICKMIFIEGEKRIENEWEANRELSKGLHQFIEKELHENSWTWQDIEAIGVFKGPGSFTGLRIGLVVLNTLAESLNVAIVGTTGDDWINNALMRIRHDENDQIVLPEYGSEAHITKPRK